MPDGSSWVHGGDAGQSGGDAFVVVEVPLGVEVGVADREGVAGWFVAGGALVGVPDDGEDCLAIEVSALGGGQLDGGEVSQAVRVVDDLFEGGAALGDVYGGPESGADRPTTTLG
ncbi:hypothetical protein ADK82_17225 [Streptomyces sp. NRRL S-4]|nr:hypothetical protein ADK82_17225 [Streptomyces sp. NRRL S-4]